MVCVSLDRSDLIVQVVGKEVRSSECEEQSGVEERIYRGMSCVAPASAGREGLCAYPTSPVEEERSTRSPRCEAFVMTGDKILNLNHHISPSYAKVARDQLPPSTKIQSSPIRRPLATGEFHSVRRSVRQRMQASTSQPDGIVNKVTSPPPAETDENKCESTSVLPASQSADSTPLAEEAGTRGAEPRLPAPMDASMHQSYYSTNAASQPAIAGERSGSGDTFVISRGGDVDDSPCRMSTVTVNATHPRSVSAASSPALKRIYGVNNNGSVPSTATATPSDGDEESVERRARRAAARLYALDGVTPADVAAQLNTMCDFSALVARAYVRHFAWSGVRIDAALRDFLARVELRGESSQRERLLQHFSRAYADANPALFANHDDVHALTCALLLLNSDLHGPNCGKKMQVRDFVSNLSGTGGKYERALLKTLYASIKQQPIVCEQSEDSPAKMKRGQSLRRKPSTRDTASRVDPESQVEYRSGWIMRKCVYDSDGAKTPFGRRGWKMFYARLRGLALYLDRDENPKNTSRYETFNNSILLHHALAEPAPDYKKKKHIFRLRTANLGEFLFQTSNQSEVDEWVCSINFVCASFSSRALPPPVGQADAFTRPRLPAQPVCAPLHDQIKAHSSAAAELRVQLCGVRAAAPPLKARGRPVEEFFFRERLLTQEIARYESYVWVLRDRLGLPAPSDSTSGVHSKSSVMCDESDRLSYREAMHQ